MTTWFVTRHAGALIWAKEEGILSGSEDIQTVSEITPEAVALGDVVIGTLPLHLVAEICSRGARYLHIAMTIPVDKRGTELSADEMRQYGASCKQFIVFSSGEHSTIEAQSTSQLPPGEGVHICLVSAQYMANLLPILKRRPAKVELVCTPEMLRSGGGLDRLARALQHFGYDGSRVTPHLTDASCSTDFGLARTLASDLREKLIKKYPGQQLTLNATGGTKTLSTAFFVEFQGFEVIYTDTQNGNCIRFLSDQQRESEPLGVQFNKIEDYLYCQGYQINDAASNHSKYISTALKRANYTQLLASNNKNFALNVLNNAVEKIETAILGKQRGKNLSEEVKLQQLNTNLSKHPISELKSGWLQEKLCKANLLTATTDGKYAFASTDAMKYLSGGWLEEWAWDIAQSCGPDHCAVNVFIRSLSDNAESKQDNKSDNELDLIILHNNRLLIAECKTIFWKGANAKQEIFNKLDALGTHARGLFGESILISAKPLDDIAMRRANSYGVKVLQAEGLPELKAEILRWMGKPN